MCPIWVSVWPTALLVNKEVPGLLLDTPTRLEVEPGTAFLTSNIGDALRPTLHRDGTGVFPALWDYLRGLQAESRRDTRGVSAAFLAQYLEAV